MNQEKTEIIWPDDLKDYLQRQKETAYLLVDVRQPAEYEQEHIPGASLMPLNELMAGTDRLPREKELVFYCSHGMRSRVAADLCADTGEFQKPVYSLMGGIAAWEEEVVPDFPRVSLFERARDDADVMKTAMNLEKGAFLFYDFVIKKCAGKPFLYKLEDIAAMETAHARLIFNLFNRDERSTTLFQDMYGALSGTVVEGGKPLTEVCRQLEAMSGNFMTNALDMALGIEYAAYDLYRSFANQSKNEAIQKAFLTLSEAEKSHVHQVAGIFQDVFKGS